MNHPFLNSFFSHTKKAYYCFDVTWGQLSDHPNEETILKVSPSLQVHTLLLSLYCTSCIWSYVTSTIILNSLREWLWLIAICSDVMSVKAFCMFSCFYVISCFVDDVCKRPVLSPHDAPAPSNALTGVWRRGRQPWINN